MIGNVRDHRKNPHCIYVNAVFEPSYHDNSVAGATQFPRPDDSFSVIEMSGTTVAAAIMRAHEEWPFPVTVYLYDRDPPLSGPTAQPAGSVH
jgi:hypothetical protein